MRIDLYLAENELCRSRTEAKNLISEGNVKVDGKTVTKPSFDVLGDEKIEVDRSTVRYVSRGGLKLEAALDEFSVNVTGALAIDVGASTGGFTDCLLQRGASHVIAVDSGDMQLNDILRGDERVTVMENFNARYMSLSDFEYSPSLAVMDVSFISATLIFPALSSVLSNGADFVCLVKPQFEVGKSGLGKGGIVKSEALRKEALNNVIASAAACGFSHVGTITSPILGGDGNVEYLTHFRKES